MRKPSVPGRARAVLTALALPPSSLALISMLGLFVAGLTVHRAGGLLTSALALAVLWLTSCNRVAVWLSRALLPQIPCIEAVDLGPVLSHHGVQAVVVLGAGIDMGTPEYGMPQLSHQSEVRLRYGMFIARRTGLPMAFAGGIGWSGIRSPGCTEGSVARAAIQEAKGVSLRWVDEESRDTRGNAERMAALLLRDGVTQVALVTHAWHMPRAMMAFERVGLRPFPTPTGFIAPVEWRLLEWLPSGHGLMASRLVFREWLALRMEAARR